MSGTVIPERITRAIEHLSPSPAARVLEIGCGPGVAVELLCTRLKTGRIMALDRSATAITRARRRNASAVAAHQVEFVHTDLADARLPSRSFDLVFALNVNAFWAGQAGPELSIVRRVLKPRGAFWLFYEAPTTNIVRLARHRELLLAALRAQEFSRCDVRDWTPGARPFLALRAQP